MPFCTKAFNCHLVICNNFQSINYLMLGPCTCDQCTVCWQLLQCVQSGGIIPNPRMCQHATERKSLTGIMHKKLWKKSSRQNYKKSTLLLVLPYSVGNRSFDAWYNMFPAISCENISYITRKAFRNTY